MENRGRVHGRRTDRLTVAAVALSLVGIVGVAMLTRGSPETVAPVPPSIGTLPSSRPTADPTPDGSPTARPITAGALEPGRYVLDAGSAWIDLTLPAGWTSTNGGTTLLRPSDPGPGPTSGADAAVTIEVHDPTGVAADLCDPSDPAVPAGHAVGTLVAALLMQIGTQRSGPVAIPFGGYHAQRIGLSAAPGCEGAAVRRVWTNAAGADLTLDGRGTVTVYVVDAAGERVVLVIEERGISPAQTLELEAVVASMIIEPARPGSSGRPAADPGLRAGWNKLLVGDVPLWFRVPRPVRWEAAHDGIDVLSRSLRGPQDAEAIVAWTLLPEAAPTAACLDVWGRPVDASLETLAGAMVAAPGTDILVSPTEVAVGGRRAVHLAVAVRADQGCGAGYYFDLEIAEAGAMWTGIEVGDTIDGWLVDLGERHLLIEAIARDGDRPRVADEVEAIVGSVAFE